MSFLLGGLRHHLQEYDRGSARLQASLLFLATIGILVTSAVSDADSRPDRSSQEVEHGLSVLLIAAYGLGLLFSLKTHRELFGGTGCTPRPAKRPGPWGWPWRRWPASRYWSRW